jgi:hypothetical protein
MMGLLPERKLSSVMLISAGGGQTREGSFYEELMIDE